jgi:hypothetical protein
MRTNLTAKNLNIIPKSVSMRNSSTVNRDATGHNLSSASKSTPRNHTALIQATARQPKSQPTDVVPENATAYNSANTSQNKPRKHTAYIQVTAAPPKSQPTDIVSASAPPVAVRASVHFPQKIYFLHLHKSGGTSICNAAIRNGLKANKNNCNVQADQRCCGGETIAEQQQFARETKYDFVASESYMYAELDVADYIYVTTLRNSMARYMSHYNHVKRKRQTESFDAWLSGQPDNWNVRHICGTRCMNIPKFALSSDDFYFTSRRLSHFSHILFHETLQHSFNKMARKLAWKINSLWHDQASPKSYNYPHVAWTRMTYLDDLLYEKAKQNALANISIHDIEQVIQTMTRNASSHGNPCGFHCSTY